MLLKQLAIKYLRVVAIKTHTSFKECQPENIRTRKDDSFSQWKDYYEVSHLSTGQC